MWFFLTSIFYSHFLHIFRSQAGEKFVVIISHSALPIHTVSRRLLSTIIAAQYHSAEELSFTHISHIFKELNMSSTGIAVGLKKGYPVEKKVQAVRPSNKKGVSRIINRESCFSTDVIPEKVKVILENLY